MAKILKRCGHQEWKGCQDPWVVRWWEPNGAAWKQRERSFKTTVYEGKTYQTVYKAAEAFGKDKEATKHDAPAVPTGGAVTFAEYAGKWLASDPGSVSTVRIYSSVMRLHLLPVLGERTLADVAADREGIKSLLASMSPSTAQSAYSALRALLREAIEAGTIDSHKLARIRPSAAHKAANQVKANGAFVFPTHAELTKLTNELPEDLRPIVALMRGCGLRAGEALAVKVENFTNGHLRVTEQRQGSPDRLCSLKAKDPGYFRDVPVPAYVKAIIQAQPITSGYLFPEWTNTTFNTAWRAAAKRAGVEWIHPHLLRHNFASVALAAGTPIPEVAAWMGDTIQVLCRTYAHVIPKGWDTARQALDAEYESWSAS